MSIVKINKGKNTIDMFNLEKKMSVKKKILLGSHR